MDSTTTHSQTSQPGETVKAGVPPCPVFQHMTPGMSDSDEINLLEYIYVLVKNKWWIIGAAALGLVLGYVAAKIKGPTWVSEAVIAAKESESQKAPNLSGFGAFGGLVASQFSLAGNPGLDKIDLILESKKFGSEVVEKHNLLPLIYKISWPKEYKKFYDTLQNSWSEDFVQPNLLKVGNHIKKDYLIKSTNKNNTMNLRFESRDSLFSDTLLSLYLTYLNNYIQTTVQTEARENVRYLENQLITVSDPLLREKLQSMIATELEKAMLVSKEAFKIIDPKFTSKQFKEQMLYPIIFSSGLLFLVGITILFFYAMFNSIKCKDDKLWFHKIRNELTI